MIHVSAIVPTQYEVSVIISESVKIEDVLIKWIQGMELFGSELPVQFVEHPGYCAQRDEFGCYNSVANFIANELQFCLRVYHFGSDHTEMAYCPEWQM